ncbi:MAG: rhodanese-like domain-containing protein [Gammaproteobacteria bacterium]|nr:rhodanese-like domain-containing protein [Gammaproteobacteria bacterium]
MEQFVEFVTNHIILAGAFVALSTLLFIDLFGAKLKGYPAVGPSEATHLINREDAVILDIREGNEFLSGHIVNSIHIPLGNLQDRQGELEKFKNKPIIAVCRSGQRSGTACARLKKAGFENIYNLKGGIMAWQHASLPLDKS